MNSHQHLSEGKLDEYLMGIPSPETSVHLASCPDCAQRVAAFQSQFALFNHTSLAWASARSNTISRDLAAHKATPRLTLSALCSSFAALILTVTIGVGAGMHRGIATPGGLNASSAEAETSVLNDGSSEPEIASDNAMLADIQSAIVTPQPTRFGLYEASNEFIDEQVQPSPATESGR